MGLFSFLNKDVECEKCGIILKNNQMGTFDTSYQGRVKNGQAIRFCNMCMNEELIKSIREFEEKAIIIYPSKKYNAYAFYQFDELIKNARDLSWEEDLVNGMKSFLPTELDACGNCHESASFTLCSLDIFENGNPYKWAVSTADEFDYKYVCKDCLIEELTQSINDNEILLSTVYPPNRGEGFLTPWEV